MARDEFEYLNLLEEAQGIITGRFHAVCMALLTETPFFAVSSNAAKVERLIQDVGLKKDRVVGIMDLPTIGMPPPFSEEELFAIRGFRNFATEQSTLLYQDLVSLAA